MSGPAATLPWLARHELRLAWRDAVAALRGGRRLPLVVAVVELVLHAIAYEVVAPAMPSLLRPDAATRLALTGSLALTGALLLSQAVEAVTRAFYARGDLDLILSAPVPARRAFAVRLGAVAATTVATAAVLAGPAVDVAVALGGPRFLCAYGVLLALGLAASAGAALLVALLFRLVGAGRTRFAAQVAAAVIGAGFAVGVQAAAFLDEGTLSRLAPFRSPAWLAAAPGPGSLMWWPIRAATGEVGPLFALLAAAAALFVAATGTTAGAFARDVGADTTLATRGRAAAATAARPLRVRSPVASLRRKELVLLVRDPWLVGQSLMQVLYLIPPALMLWTSFGAGTGELAVLPPILVMAAGQIAGGLAWLAVSGEDAPDLVASAPLPRGAALRGKVEAVALAVAVPVAPLVAALAFAAPVLAAVTAAGALLAAAGAGAVQYLFRTRGRRSQFRRRQSASRLATVAEALVSISVAAASGLAAAGSWFAPAPLLAGIGVLLAARALAGPAERRG